ncbi:MAG: glycoside hydrolase family 3 protein, partial [bacterium]
QKRKHFYRTSALHNIKIMKRSAPVLSFKNTTLFLLIIAVCAVSVINGIVFINEKKRARLINSKMESMSLQQKIGQLLMMGIRTPQYQKVSDAYVEAYSLGGVILFTEALKSQGQVKEMISNLQNAAMRHAAVPLFVAVDQEGGKVNRVGLGLTHIPGNMAVSAAGSEKYARIAGEINGMELKSLGINVNLAPCVDVLKFPSSEVIGTRSYGSEILSVATFSRAYFRGLKKYDVLGCAKHFPNHGAVKEDSHEILPQSSLTKEQILKYIIPYRMLIDDDIDMIMPAHINWKAIDKKNIPGTISADMIYGLLRTELDYQGVVISDALEMYAVAANYSIVEAAVKFIDAGGDIILLGKSYDLIPQVIAGMHQAIEQGILSESRINESVHRILKLKYSLFKNLKYDAAAEPKITINWDENKKWAYRIARKSIRRYGSWETMPVITRKSRLLIVSSSSIWDKLGKTRFKNSSFLHIPRNPRKYITYRNQLREEIKKNKYDLVTFVCETNDQSKLIQHVLDDLNRDLPASLILSEDLSFLQNKFFKSYPVILLWGPSQYSRQAALQELMLKP